MFLLAGPAHDFLPAPLWVLTGLHVLTLTVHLLAMNFLVGGLVVMLTGPLGDRWQNPAVRRLLKLFPVAVAATVTFGVAPLLFAQLVYGRILYSAAIVSGWFWLGVPLAVIVAYYFLYAGALARTRPGRIRVWGWVALVALVFVSVVYSSVFALAEAPELQRTLYAEAQSGLMLNPQIGVWLPRWLHMLTGAIAVGGFFFGLLGRDDETAFKAGRAYFVWGTIASVLTGIGYLTSLGEHVGPFMASPGIWLVTVGVLAGLGAVHFFVQRRFAWSGSLLGVAVLGMVGARHTLRLIALEGTFDPATLRVEPQWGVFAIFVVCLLIALGVMAWMVRRFFRARHEEPAS